jgi:hypothetical protein
MNLWKKTLLATAVAAISTGAMAVDITTGNDQITYGSEALTTGFVANNGSVLHIGQPKLTSGAEYTENDVLVITAVGGTFAADGDYTLSDSPYSESCTFTGTNPAECGVPGDDGDVADGNTATKINSTITWGLINQTETELTFRATAITDATPKANTTGTDGVGAVASTKGNTFTLQEGGANNVDITLASTAKDATVSLTAKAQTNNGYDLDGAGEKDTFDIGKVINEHKLSVSPLMSAVVDVTKERKEFADPAEATFTATYTYTAADQAKMPGTTNSVKVSGPLGAFPGEAEKGQLTDGTTALTVADDAMSASIDYATGPVTKTFSFEVGTDAEQRQVIDAGSFNVEMKVSESGKEFTLGAVEAGTFKLNGASYDIPYLPYGNSTERYVWITNKGVQPGDITVTALEQDGTEHEFGVIGESKKGLMKIDSLIDAKLEEAGVATGQSIQLNVTVNAPDSDITVYAAYKAVAADDRLTVPANSLNLNP